jgi:chorismate mutase
LPTTKSIRLAKQALKGLFFVSTLQELRDEIEIIDALIIQKLAERQALSKEIGLIKHEAGKEITDFAREKLLLQRYEVLCEQYDLEPSFVKRVFKLIILHSRGLQS